MRSVIVTGFLFLQIFCACSSEETKPTSENDVDAARNFINAVLQANFDKAGDYLVPDSANKEYMALTEQSFERKSPEERKMYAESSINIHGVKPVNDTVTIVHYSNSYKNIKDSIKVVRVDQQWLIDLKYSLAPKHAAE